MGTAKSIRQKRTPKKANAKSDTLTMLVCADKHRATKKFVRAPDSSIEKLDYDAGTHFGVMVRVVRDITSLSVELSGIEPLDSVFVIRGEPVDPKASTSFRRTKVNFVTPATGRRWVMIDFDKIKIPDGLALLKDAAAVVEYLVRQLPAEFHDVSYHYQLSSSAGMGDPGMVSAHIWFWLIQPWPDSELKAWAKAINGLCDYKLIDAALFNDVQIHYTAAPIFNGVTNPFPKRSALVRKGKDAVLICKIKTPEHPTPESCGPCESGPGSDGWLARIGDHSGGEGFHEPIIKAIASYVSTNGRDGTNVETLYETVRDRVLAADRSNHDDAYVEGMASREHIMQAIQGALQKYGDQPASRRRARVVKGMAPPALQAPLCAAEAHKKLSEALDSIIGGPCK